MKAMGCEKFGQADVLKPLDVPEPQLQPDDILVEVHDSGLNPGDTKIRTGGYGQGNFPLVLGFDVSGVVKQCGPNVSKFKPGDEVYGCASLIRQGSNAERIAMGARLVPHCWPAGEPGGSGSDLDLAGGYHRCAG